MSNISPSSESESELLQSLLDPLLEDFRYWFGLSLELIESQRLDFLSESEQSHLIDRVQSAIKEVDAATMLYRATGKQVSIDVAIMMPWHNLLLECQAVAIRYRQNKAN